MRAALATVLILSTVPSSGFAEVKRGYLQVRAEAGVEVEVEGVAGRPAKVAEDDTGVTFRDLDEGRYFVVARREGFETQRGWIDVVLGNVTVFTTKPWQPLPKRGDGGVGSLIVQTFPVDATVDAKRLGWRKIKKGDAPFIASAVPAGTHKLTFCNSYKCIDYRATIEAGQLLSIIVDFEPGAIEDVSDLHRQQLHSWRSTCAAGTDDACRRACEIDVALTPERRSLACLSIGRTIVSREPTEDQNTEPVNAKRAIP